MKKLVVVLFVVARLATTLLAEEASGNPPACTLNYCAPPRFHGE